MDQACTAPFCSLKILILRRNAEVLAGHTSERKPFRSMHVAHDSVVKTASVLVWVVGSYSHAMGLWLPRTGRIWRWMNWCCGSKVVAFNVLQDMWGFEGGGGGRGGGIADTGVKLVAASTFYYERLQCRMEVRNRNYAT